MNSLVITTRSPSRRITPRLKIQIIIPTPTRLIRRTHQKVQLPPIRTSGFRDNRITLQAPCRRARRAVEV
jgi:hypothetical protein